MARVETTMMAMARVGTLGIPEMRAESRGTTRNREMVENRGTQEEEIGSGSDTETVSVTETVTVTATVIATVGEDTRELGTDEAANDWLGTKRLVDLLTCGAGLMLDAQSKRVLAPIDVEDQIFWGQFI